MINALLKMERMIWQKWLVIYIELVMEVTLIWEHAKIQGSGFQADETASAIHQSGGKLGLFLKLIKVLGAGA